MNVHEVPLQHVWPRRLILIGLGILMLATTAPAQRGTLGPDTGDAGTGGRFVIQGSVYFPSGQRVDRPIKVKLSTMTRGDMTTMTDDMGVFWFRRLAPGTYTVVIDGEKEYDAVTEQVSIVQPMSRSINAPEEIISVQIRLRLHGEGPRKPAVVNAELANVPQHALQLYNEAQELGRAGKSKPAVEKLKEAIAAHASFMLAFNELGVQYMHLGELQKADDALRAALKLSPDAFMPLQNHGIVLALLSDYDAAVTDLRHALSIKEQSVIAHFYLGQALANLGRLDEAEQHLTRAVALGGKDVKDAHRFLGAIYLHRGDRQQAINEFEAYLRLSPSAKDADQIRQILRQLKR